MYAAGGRAEGPARGCATEFAVVQGSFTPVAHHTPPPPPPQLLKAASEPRHARARAVNGVRKCARQRGPAAVLPERWKHERVVDLAHAPRQRRSQAGRPRHAGELDLLRHEALAQRRARARDAPATAAPHTRTLARLRTCGRRRQAAAAAAAGIHIAATILSEQPSIAADAEAAFLCDAIRASARMLSRIVGNMEASSARTPRRPAPAVPASRPPPARRPANAAAAASTARPHACAPAGVCAAA